MILSDAHIHTVMCDGKDSAADMARAASEKGFYSLGFSGHSYVDFDPQYSVKNEKVYLSEIDRLKKLYDGKMKIYTGIELDYCTKKPASGYEYIIGSVHYIPGNGRYYLADASQKEITDCADELYDGDIYGVTQKYFELVAENAIKNKPNIIGHFDVIKKCNRMSKLIDEENPKYTEAALSAVRACADTGAIFEVNTGGIRRGSGLYPSLFVLKEIKRLNAKLIITSDAHCKEDIGAGFQETSIYLKYLGFNSVYTLSDKAGKLFTEVQI